MSPTIAPRLSMGLVQAVHSSNRSLLPLTIQSPHHPAHGPPEAEIAVTKTAK
ncbi:hypothetical protein E4U34_001145, partial [Claviceps purpurea]